MKNDISEWKPLEITSEQRGKGRKRCEDGLHRCHIKKVKRYKPFEPYKTAEFCYVRMAYKIAEDYLNNRPIDPEFLADCRELAAGDVDHLKADFVISMFLDMIKWKGKGKTATYFERYGAAVLNMAKGEGKSVRAIAETLEISYNSVQSILDEWRKRGDYEKEKRKGRYPTKYGEIKSRAGRKKKIKACE